MKKMNNRNSAAGLPRGVAVLLLLATMVVTSACYTPTARRAFDRNDGSIPWWCEGSGGHPDLSDRMDCLRFSLEMDNAVLLAQEYPTLGDAQAAGAGTIASQPTGIGHAVIRPGSGTDFDGPRPNVLLYNGTQSDSRIAGVAWRVFGAEPAGFTGTRDVWQYHNGDSHWWLSAWVVRGYQNHDNVFAATQPCLAANVVPTSTATPCYAAAHSEPFEVIVTNDDGYGAEGIYALVEGLSALPNVTVHVVAPGANQSGSGDAVTGEEYIVSATGVTMTDPNDPAGTSYPATAVWSTDPDRPNGSGSPADSVFWALDEMNLSADLVLSGINEGQNMVRPIVNISGTVGAARTARLQGYPAIATSQGQATGALLHPDYAAGVAGTLDVLEEWRLGTRLVSNTMVPNINIPSCQPGSSVRGIVDVAVALTFTGGSFSAQDCTSTVTGVTTDLEAFNNGFIGVSDVTTADIP